MAQYVVVDGKKYLINGPATVPSFGLKPSLPSTVVTAKETEKK